MDRILEALRKLLPEDQLNEVAGAIKAEVNQARKELEAEYNSQLEKAYAELSEELASAEKTAYQGYQEAYGIIAELRNRLETQRDEFKAALDEGYEEAYQMLLAEREKNRTLEVEMYEEYDKKLAEMKDYMVDKLDQFLQFKGAEIYEQAKRDVMNDPRMAEHKVALDKIVEIAGNYLSDEDYAFATSHKLEETRKSLEDLRGQLRIMEARNIRLSTDNTKLTEQVRHAAQAINESRKVTTESRRRETAKNERTERVERSRNASGRGHTHTEEGVVIAEYANNDSSEINELLVLSGVKNGK
jgi:hypothetical protein